MHLRFLTTMADNSKYLILESGCLASCVELAFFRWRPPEFLHGPMSLLSKDWFACDVNLCKYLCHSPNGFAHTIQALWEITSQERHSGIHFISENEYCTSLLILSLQRTWFEMFSYFWLPNIERYFKHWASCLSRKRKLDDQRKKIKAPNVLPLATKGN